MAGAILYWTDAPYVPPEPAPFAHPAQGLSGPPAAVEPEPDPAEPARPTRSQRRRGVVARVDLEPEPGQ